MEIAAMSPPVSPQRRRDRGSGPTDRGGFSPTAAQRLPSQKKQLKPESRKSPQYLPLCRRNGGEIGGVVQRTEGVFHPQQQSGLSTIPQSSKINNFSYFRTPPALRATSPIRAPCAAEEDITTHLPHTNFTARLPTSQFPRLSTLNPQLSTLNHRPLTLNNKETPLPEQRRFLTI